MTARITGFIAALTALAAIGFTTSSVLAQDTRRDGPTVVELEPIELSCPVPRPRAFYILQRSDLGSEVTELRRSFVRDTVRSVEGEPF